MENLRKIKVERLQYIDNGAYGEVYKISPTLIVKAFFTYFSKEQQQRIAKDEIRGSKLFKSALPVQEIVTVILPSGQETIGLIKQYIPYEVSFDELKLAIKEQNKMIPKSYKK